jgi:hypothetical protein
MKKRILNILLAGAALGIGACTDLEVKETDSIVIGEGEFNGVNAEQSLNAAYNDLGTGDNTTARLNTQQNLFALTEATTDELFIPTRGTDWGDNGVWRDLARHAWTPAHAYNRATWNYLNGNVYRTNQILHERTTATAQQIAEAKFLRAWNMFYIFDLWRQVPFRAADEGPEVDPLVLTGQEAFDFIAKDLEEALPNLPAVEAGQVADQKRASQAAAHLVRARLFLNKHIYLNAAEADDADMDIVIEHVEAIEALGYELQEGFFDIFAPTADSETIFWSTAQIGERIWGSLHYFQGKETDQKNGGWNGFATTAEFYSKFEGDPNVNEPGSGQEERRGYVPTDGLGIGFLIGQQYGPETAEPDAPSVPLKARSGAPLAFTKEVPTLTGNSDITGIRLLKYHPNVSGGSFVQHQIILRYADAHLMKAEALFRKGSTAEALDHINELRSIRDAEELGSLDEQDIIDERGRELYMEFVRRTDLIRFGQFNAEFGFNENPEEFRNVMPIPDNAVATNPNLTQNDGY